MIFSPEDLAALDPVKLSNPPAFFWPGYMWLWLSPISHELIDQQLAEFCQIGARTIWILPLAKTWRAYRLPTELEPEFMSDEFGELIRYTLARARELDLCVWLNDEPGYPSGGNVGQIVKEKPELIARQLDRQEIALAAGQQYQVPDDCLAAFAGELYLKPGQTWTATAPVTLQLYLAQPVLSLSAPNYTDLLHSGTAPAFLEHCYEKWQQLAGAYFGTTVPVIFFDEPKVNNPPWTDDLAASFLQEKGYDILPLLPQLFSEDASGSQVRIDYFDWWTNKLAERFFRPLKEWCRQNDVRLTGHFGGDDYTLGNKNHGYGHILRLLRQTDLPCVDTIWRQIWPGLRRECDDGPWVANHHFPKYASSVAHQEGLPFAGSESFAVYGSGLTPAYMKWITDYQYVRGINILTMSNALSSTKDYFSGRIRPTYVPLKANPLNQYLDLFHAYTARLSFLLSLGRPLVDAALYFPIRDVWAGGSRAQKAAASHDLLAEQLLSRQIDFDLIDDDLLASPATRLVDGRLKVGPMQYDTVYLARDNQPSASSEQLLERFRASGGQVKSEADGRGPLKVQPEQAQLRVMRRQLADGRLYFLVNEAEEALSCKLEFFEEGNIYLLDPATGQVLRPRAARRSKKNWQLELELDFAGSCLVYFTNNTLPARLEPPRPGRELVRLDKGWQLEPLRQYVLGEHDFAIQTLSSGSQAARLGDWSELLGQDFAGDVAYRLQFSLAPDQAENAAILDLGQLNFACQVSLNGHELGRKAWAPFYFYPEQALKAGLNQLEVIVSNSMANQFVYSDKLDKWPDNVIGPYHKIAKPFEEETVSWGSGLFGPVRLLAARQENEGER